MELETVLVNENFNDLQTALAPLLVDCDDVLSQSRLRPFFCLPEALCSFSVAHFSPGQMREASGVDVIVVPRLDIRLHGYVYL